MAIVKRTCSLLLAVILLFALTAPCGATAAEDDLQRQIDRYNCIIGTNAFSPSYQFTDADPMTELADVIEAWGSNMIKFNAREDDTLVDRVLDGRDYDYVFMWYRSSAYFKDGYTEAEARADYDAFYAFTKKLLLTYSGTGKEFFLGHWEGDWYYTDHYDTSQASVDDAVTEGMIAWLNNRQQAVDDAKRDTPHSDVSVWNYVELNRPCDAILKGYDRVVNRVLPRTNVDYVSYSAYDSMNAPAWMVRRVIRYIDKHLPDKSGVTGPRVFIGEVAKSAGACGYDDAVHCEENLRILSKFLRCDVRFVLYWQMYCNEEKEDGTNNGYWLIDADGNRTQLYRQLSTLFADGKAYVRSFAEKNGRVPTNREYRTYLLHHPILSGADSGWLALRADVRWVWRAFVEQLRTWFRIAG